MEPNTKPYFEKQCYSKAAQYSTKDDIKKQYHRLQTNKIPNTTLPTILYKTAQYNIKHCYTK